LADEVECFSGGVGESAGGYKDEVSVEEEEDGGLRENEVLGVVEELIKGTGVGVRDLMSQEGVADV